MEPKVVVIDDEPDLLFLLCTVLEEEGMETVGMSHPDAVLSDETLSDAALLLIDLMLPGMDGIMLARHLRSDGLPDVPMIAMSASQSMLQRASDSCLFQETLPKPFDLGSLLACVERSIQTGIHGSRARHG